MTLLIAIEGIDGSGKGTQSTRLVERLCESGLSAARMQFPRYSDTSFGTAIGDFLNGKFGDLDTVHPQLAAVLYAGDRFESKAELESTLQSHDVLVLDRYTGSSLAHQGAKLEGEARAQLLQWIDHMEHTVFQLPRPQLNILIDITSDWSQELVGRKAARDYTDQKADIQEADQSYLERVRSSYRELAAARDDWTVVQSLCDGELRDVEDINAELLSLITPLVGRRPSNSA